MDMEMPQFCLYKKLNSSSIQESDTLISFHELSFTITQHQYFSYFRFSKISRFIKKNQRLFFSQKLRLGIIYLRFPINNILILDMTT